MKVLLINIPIWKDIGFQSNFNPGMGLLYIGAVLREHGHEVRIIDAEAMRWWHDDLFDVVTTWKPTHIGLSCISNGVESLISFSKIIKSLYPQIWIALGGVGPSSDPERILKDSLADSLCVGEGELVLEDVFSKPGIHQGISPQNLDELPFPAYDLMEPRIGGKMWQGNLPRPEIDGEIRETVVMWSRGCPHACIFCSKSTMPRKYPRLRSKEKIVEELKMLQKDFGINSVFVYDDELIGMGEEHNKWLYSVVHEIMEELDGKIYFKGQGRCSEKFIHDDEQGLLFHMKLAGFFAMMMGCESGSDDVKKAIKKGTTNADIRHTLKTLHESGIKIYGFWMIGMPTETEEEARKTEKLIAEMTPYMDWIQVTVFSPLRGSDFWDEAIEKGYMKEIDELRNWEETPQLDMPWMPKERILSWRFKLYSVFNSIKRDNIGG